MPHPTLRVTRPRMTEQPSHIDRRLSEAITQPTAITLTVIEDPPPNNRRSSAVSPDLVPRTIYFPPKWLARVEAQGPGALITLLTVALSAQESKGGV